MDVIEYPSWLRRALVLAALLHDVPIVVAGFIAFYDAPPTIAFALDHLSLAWAWMLIIGGIISVAGLLARHVRTEVTGCALASAAKLVWVVALLQAHAKDNPTPFGTGVLACILIAGAASTVWRIMGLWVGVYLKVKETP